MPRANKQLNSIERDLIDGFKELVGDLAADKPLPAKYTRRNVAIDLAPREYTPEEVQETRAMLQLSQAVFAQFLGVSTNTVCAWESGKPISEMARRFMDEIRINPAYWRKRLVAVSKPKRAVRTIA